MDFQQIEIRLQEDVIIKTKSPQRSDSAGRWSEAVDLLDEGGDLPLHLLEALRDVRSEPDFLLRKRRSEGSAPLFRDFRDTPRASRGGVHGVPDSLEDAGELDELPEKTFAFALDFFDELQLDSLERAEQRLGQHLRLVS